MHFCERKLDLEPVKVSKKTEDKKQGNRNIPPQQIEQGFGVQLTSHTGYEWHT